MRQKLRLCRAVAFVALVVSTQARGQTTPEIIAIGSATAFTRTWPDSGSLGVLYCRGLVGINGIVQPPGYPLPELLEGVQVNVSDLALAPILAIADFGGYQQINFQVPWSLSAPAAWLSISQNGIASPRMNVPTSGWSPLFVDGMGQAIAQHAVDYRRVSREDPAHPGEWIIVYGSGIGAVANPPPTGMPAPLDSLSPVLDASIRPAIAGTDGPQTLEYNYAGLTPGSVGLWQVNLRVPDLQPDGDVRLAILRYKFCGFFYVPGCGRGFVTQQSTTVVLPVRAF